MQPASRATIQPLTIGIFVVYLPPEYLGGAELQADRLARELAARGHRVHVFARRQAGSGDTERRDGVIVHRRPVLPLAGLRLAGEIVQGAVQAARARPDVLVCYSPLNSGLLGLAARRLCGAPVVVWLQGVGEARLRPFDLRRRTVHALLQRADGVWLQAESLVDTLRCEYGAVRPEAEWRRLEPRLRVVANGIDVRPESDGPPPPPARFLFVGRLVREKDLPTLVEAARHLPGIEVAIAGSGPLAGSLQRQAAGAPVRFLGEQPHARIPELLRDCRALVLPSREEGLPNVVLEALAQGRPVVATPVGAVPELVQDGVNGRLVPVGDATALAAAMRDLLDDGTWRRLAAAARPSVARFGWPALASRVESELSSLVAGRRGSR